MHDCGAWLPLNITAGASHSLGEIVFVKLILLVKIFPYMYHIVHSTKEKAGILKELTDLHSFAPYSNGFDH